MTLDDLPTPSLLIDRPRLDRNIERMRAQLARWPEAMLRPHLKTVKSVDVARLVTNGPITVSTLKEAEVFADAGYTDILYAVGIAPAKLDRVAALAARGIAMSVILDSIDTAHATAAFAAQHGARFGVLIEIDTDGHRGGLRPGDPAIVAIARILAEAGLLKGVVTHAGGSYDARSESEIVAYAVAERDGVVAAAAMLRDAGLPCPTVSLGSTPTALFAPDLSGVTEVRAGVYIFLDLVMAGIGVCTPDDIALSVLATVIGHQPTGGRIIVDAGWMAMSRDRGTRAQPIDQGYGLVLGADLAPRGDLILVQTNQEHGLVAARDGRPIDPAAFPIGTRLRILPNHACSTGAQHDHYAVIDGDGRVGARWERFGGW